MVLSHVSTVDSLAHKSHDDIEASFRIVLLLLDPETRRFETLNPAKKSVSFVLAQSFGSTTAESLQKATYSGLMGSNGVHRSDADLLSSFCIGNDVVVGIQIILVLTKLLSWRVPFLWIKTLFKWFIRSKT